MEFAEQKGRAEGLAEGMAKGKAEERRIIAGQLKRMGMSFDAIREVTGLSDSEIDKL
jgi:predicted transposase YdaD